MESKDEAGSHSAWEVLGVFLKLGLTSFGGPVAHLGYYREAFVHRRRWLDEEHYADLLALCQFLPGPASSQIAFSIGLLRAGWRGALAAWCGFTLPSAVLLVIFAYSASRFDNLIGSGLVHGLKLAAVAVVAQAVWDMSRRLCPDAPRRLIAVGALGVVLLADTAYTQLIVIALGAVAGIWLCRSEDAGISERLLFPVSRRAGVFALTAFFVLLFGLAALSASHIGGNTAALLNAFYRTGALVFGGGHVVLPLLQQQVVDPGWVSDDVFLTGYGAAQAVPGPLFSFAAYLGAVMYPGPYGLWAAALALVAIFLPGLLLVTGVLPFWDALRRRIAAQAAMRGANATVVGILGAALYQPVWTSAVHSVWDIVLVVLAFILLVAWRTAPILVVAICAGGGILLGLLASPAGTLF